MPDLPANLPQDVLAVLPACYTIEFGKCLKRRPNAYPNCEQVLSVYYGPHGDAMDDAVEAMPICEAEYARLDAARQVLPSCYTPALDSCIDSQHPEAEELENCPLIWEAGVLDPDFFDDLPFCDEPTTSQPKPFPWLLVAGGVAVVGVLAYAVGARK